MTSQTFYSFDTLEECPQNLGLRDEPTCSIDLKNLFSPEFTSSGLFDLRSIGSTALGKLLEAIPIPIMLIDKWFFVVYANGALNSISSNCENLQGSRFIDALPVPDDPDKALVLKEKTTALLEKVLADRKPVHTEAILKIGDKRIWARLHLRSVRFSADRHIMAIIQDITSDRTQNYTFQKGQKRLRKELAEYKARINRLQKQLAETTANLQTERERHEMTKQQVLLENFAAAKH
ncbi:PAS domain-containing protein [Desulfomonile tiedjei]|uniref:PAS domain-containing protein n=1 Tax=Desulfomonile tiedjei (strain ATCC 49306 / DSM 6799 / DCB-1) TaxID=706587 RepID=I4C5T6_DESTA|nr:PAS domain-containing protein [Desulfomonile tiedjei]AFM24927.1 PAS domain-containing protein [Desulfomonile tiedjei DSM 6799]